MSVEEFRRFREKMKLFETFSVGLVVGGSIVTPHLRRAVATVDELRPK